VIGHRVGITRQAECEAAPAQLTSLRLAGTHPERSRAPMV
jgi:hypothetical protein